MQRRGESAVGGRLSGPKASIRLSWTGQPPAAVTTLADGRVLVAGNTDRWIRNSVGDRD